MTPETGTPAVRLAHEYLAALQAKDRPRILAILADDFVLEVPCNLSGSNDLSDSWSGKDVASARFDATFQKIEVLRFVDLEVHECVGPGIVFAEGRGEMVLATGRPYENRYVFRFEVSDELITRIREYVNPISAALAMGLPLPGPTDEAAPPRA